MTVNNVAETLGLVHKLNDETLKEKSIRFIRQNLEQVKNSEGWKVHVANNLELVYSILTSLT